MRPAATLSAAALVVGLASGLVGCGLKPTRAYEIEPRFSPAGAGAGSEGSLTEPIALTADTVVIDARRPFDFATSRIPRSLSMQWSDFTQPMPAQRGVLQADLFQVARRLARAGVDLDAPVVVVGYGRAGSGEEGRIAWMLRYLGVKQVRFASFLYFPGPFASLSPIPSPDAAGAPPDEPPQRNAPMWKPVADLSWLATRSELREVLNKNGVSKPLRAGPLAQAKAYALIDARPARDYLGQEGFGAARSVPNMGAVNAPWTEFIDAKGRPSCAPLRRLAQAGVTPDKRVVAFDELGLGSGAVVVALRACGYPDAANYAGGLRDLLSEP
jgi:thiosulfate/3-mercaptopyruvate sulfurtransferase